MAPDGRMFQTSGRKGELFELKNALNASSMKERKTALKRTVAAMTMGKDVSSLFTDVVKNTAGDLAMKKLVYLYIINYAHVKPDLSILIVNTFIKDATDYNPLVRALAIRTMALLPLEKITEYLCDPLRAAIHDSDPYVRKTAAVSVAKLYSINPDLAVEEGFVNELQEMLKDGNAMTVANAVAALSEIAYPSSPHLLGLNASTVSKYLSALSECTEWGQIFILDALTSYTPTDRSEVDPMVERIVPRLQHANPAVVLAAVKIIVKLMPLLDSDAKRDFLLKKMGAPLVTLLNAQPEVQFVALRNISLLIQQYPDILGGDVKVFFVFYADPLYVKIEKLDALVQSTRESNANLVLAELLEYSTEVDVVFAQKAVACIGRIAVSVPAISGECIDSFYTILKRRVVHLTEQVAISLNDVLREYPNQFDRIVHELYDSSDDIEDPAARAALVWICGEYVTKFETSMALLRSIAENIAEEVVTVQLQVISACMNAYLQCGEMARSMADHVLNYATTESENVDVRDRGMIYMRLLSSPGSVASKVVLTKKKDIRTENMGISEELRKELLQSSLSTLASVYHKSGRLFEGPRRKTISTIPVGEAMAEEDLLGLDREPEESQRSAPKLALTDGLEQLSIGALAPVAVAPPEKQMDQDLFGGLL